MIAASGVPRAIVRTAAAATAACFAVHLWGAAAEPGPLTIGMALLAGVCAAGLGHRSHDGARMWLAMTVVAVLMLGVHALGHVPGRAASALAHAGHGVAPSAGSVIPPPVEIMSALSLVQTLLCAFAVLMILRAHRRAGLPLLAAFTRHGVVAPTTPAETPREPAGLHSGLRPLDLPPNTRTHQGEIT